MPTKTVHYRRFDPTSSPWTKGSLKSLLNAALRTETENGSNYLENWRARQFPTLNDSQLIRFCHSLMMSEDFIFGTMCLFLPDDWAIVMKQETVGAYNDQHKSLNETMKAIEVAERPPLAGEDYLRGIAYWLVVGDHFFVVQHTSIQTKAFEEYFYQMLCRANIIADKDTFALRSEFDKSTVGGDLEEINAVEIGGVMNRGLTPSSVAEQTKIEETEEQKTVGRRVARFEKAWDVLRAVFGDPNAETILASIPTDAELEVDVRFGYKTRSRKLSRETLGDIARAARNLPDGEVVAYGKNGKQIGDDLRLSMNMPFKLIREKGALLDLDDARTQLLRVYQRFVEDDKIVP